MAPSLALVCGLWTLGSAARVGRKSNQTGVQWHSVMYDGRMTVGTEAAPAFLYLHEKKVYVSHFGVKHGSLLPLPAKSEITTLSVNDIGSALASGRMRQLRMEVEVEDPQMLWPNKLDHAPPSVQGNKGPMLVIPDGFLVPTKSDGNILLHQDGKLHRITPQLKGHFYHEVEWRDMDGDGHLDILCPRAITTFPIPSFRGEFMWYKNPGPDRMMTQEWEEHKIMDGPDVICHTVDYKDGLASFCSHFWDGTGRLMVHGLSKSGEHQWSRVIDEDCIKCFSVKPVDLDGDGVLDLLSTNHPDKKHQSGVFAHEVPWDDLKNGVYTKHVLATDIFQTILGNAGVGAPGFPVAFYPKVGTTRGPKDIVVAGDGSLDAWHLMPVHGQRFKYEPRQVAPPRGTTGYMLVHDFDGDGINDVLVPDNDMNEIFAFTFAAGPPPDVPPAPAPVCPWWCNGPGACQNNECKWNCDRCHSK